MSEIQAVVSASIAESPERVYAILSDYREGHPSILPEEYFTDLSVQVGGKGAGTLVRVRMNVWGVGRDFQLAISEPEPGRTLVETDEEAGIVTTFTVDPLDDGKQSLVTIATRAKASPGLKGLMERLVNPSITRRIYRKELRQLEEYIRQNSRAES